MNLALLYFFGSLSKRPLTFVMLMKLVFRWCASFAAVLSEVEFGSNRRAPQMTTLFFLNASFACFMFNGRESFASFFVKSCMTNCAFVRVARIPASAISFFGLPSAFRADIYFLAIVPPPQTTTNL